MPIGETLQAFAFERSEPTDEHGIYPHGLVSDFRYDHRGIATAFKGWADISADSRMGVEVARGDLLVDGIGAAGADEGCLLYAGSGGERSAEGSIADDTHLVAGVLREPEGRMGGILPSPDGGTR